MILPDVNVLIYAFRKDVPEHPICRRWLDGVVLGEAQFGISPSALSAVVRITTNPRTYKVPSSIEDAIGFGEDLLDLPSLPDRCSWRSSLGHFQAPVYRDQYARSTCHRRMVCGAGDRMGLRVDHA
jgi:predicted nucleic acid-binding protein